MPLVYLSLGSNLGSREKLLGQAVECLEERLGKAASVSSLYQTGAWGKTDQPDFINQVAAFRSDRTAREILDLALQVEAFLGRERHEKWSERTMDIDVLFYGDEVINEPGLIVPHPLLHLRRFVVEPLLEIDPELLHPVLKKKIKTIESELIDQLPVQRL